MHGSRSWYCRWKGVSLCAVCYLSERRTTCKKHLRFIIQGGIGSSSQHFSLNATSSDSFLVVIGKKKEVHVKEVLSVSAITVERIVSIFSVNKLMKFPAR